MFKVGNMKEKSTAWTGDDFRAAIKGLSTGATGFVTTVGEVDILLGTTLGRLGGANCQIYGVNCLFPNPSSVGKISQKRKDNIS